MSMPIINRGTTTTQQAVSDIIESIALMETALSHVLNAEGEKIQAAVGTLSSSKPPLAKSTEDLLNMNKSVDSLVSTVTVLEGLLQGQLSGALDTKY